jgi:hypothetical protein
MIVDFTAQTPPALWTLAAALALLALVLLACIDPELVEVYIGEAQLLLGTLALAAIVLLMLATHRADFAPELGAVLPAR